MGKVLVAYFSPGGVTATTALAIRDLTGGKAFEIIPKQLYTDIDMQWRNPKSRSSLEMVNPNFRPEIANTVENMDDYNVIFLGFPIWWYTAPRIIETFLESYNFSEKVIVPFATSGGSDMEKAQKRLQTICKGEPVWKKGETLTHRSALQIKNWIDSLDIDG